MATRPPVEPGQLSPDRRWRWDGTQWLPAEPQPSVRRRSSALAWVLAGCATVLVLGLVGVGYGAYSFVHGFLSGSQTCLPSNFPRYPGAVPEAWSFDLNGTYPGNTCHMAFQSNDDVEAVTAFYESKLNSGDWRVTRSGIPAGQINFQPAREAQPFGTVNVTVGKTRTEIAIDLFTSTCLPLGFPMYPGAGFGGQSSQVNGARECHIVFESNDSVATVTRFYQSNLNSGNWQVTSSASSEIHFRLTNGKRTIASGTMNFAVNRERTEVTIDVLD
jgi:hypothetical protein